jgi:hypothetical protein
MLDAAKGTEALQLLQEELASEDAETHTHAMRRLCLVAEALGPERSRKELVPFLSGERRTTRMRGGPAGRRAGRPAGWLAGGRRCSFWSLRA